MLRVFATNIGTGLINVALTSQLDRIAYEDGLLEIANGNALKRGVQAALEVPRPAGERSCSSSSTNMQEAAFRLVSNRAITCCAPS